MLLLWLLMGLAEVFAQTPNNTLSQKILFVKNQNPQNKYSLGQIISLGLEYNHEIKEAMANARQQRALTQMAERQILPQLNTVVIDNYQKKPSRLSSLPTSSLHNYDMALQLVQPLYTGGKFTNGIKSLSISEELANIQIYSAQQQAVKNLILTFTQLVQSKQILELTTQHYNVLKTYVDTVTNYERIGRARDMDRLQALVNLSLTEVEINKVTQDGETAESNLRHLIGFSENRTKPLELVSDSLKNLNESDIALNIAWQKAEENNPEILLAKMSQMQQEYANKIQNAEDLPSLNLIGNWGYQAPHSSQWVESNSNYYSIGLNLTIPIFSGFSSFSKKKAQMEALQGKAHHLDLIRQQVRQSLESALLGLKNSSKQFEVAKKAAQQGQQALQLANRGYKLGVVSSQDVLNAQRTRYDSEKLLIQSQFTVFTSLLQVRQIMGLDLVKLYIN